LFIKKVEIQGVFLSQQNISTTRLFLEVQHKQGCASLVYFHDREVM